MTFLTALILACLITLGWTLMLNVPKSFIGVCLLLTVSGFGTKTLLVNHDVHLVLATFCGAMVASFLGVAVSRRYILPPKTLIIPSIICLMPGIVAYKAMISMVQIGYAGFSMALFEQMMRYFFEAIFVISGLVLGLSIPSIVFYRRRPIV
ncbi:threonine/serine exporter family protein [Moraxella lincolnii]|uniref:Threonine/Serine exporter ThrE domain-containing protein n=1 Tax=Lwoffella lincolnii TaxID=90241 RepID=A0A1T0CH98_9GAMM|nr:threonine/serine exporter family protein [Moraxella lincolnii]OOS21732.1 hypothetical protein B0682_03635 [Moraxella lincolnii]